jgi:predicted exporter
LDGPNLDDLADVSKALASDMRKSGDFLLVANGQRIWTKQEKDILFRHRYLLSSKVNGSRFTPQALHEALENRLKELTSPLAPLIKAYLRADPTGEFLWISKRWLNWKEPKKHKGVWVSSDRRRAILTAETKAPGFQIDKQRKIQKRLILAFDGIISESHRFAPVKMVLAGPAVFAVESEQTIKEETGWLSILAVSLVLLFLYGVYRSWTPIFLVSLPWISGAIVGALSVNLVFGFTHAITLGFGASLIGAAVDYPIHLFSHLSADKSPKVAVRAIWPTLSLGAATTAIGFGVLLFSPFPGLSQLGLFACSGLITSAVVTRWVLPDLMPRYWNRTEPWGSRFYRIIRRFGRRPFFVVMAPILATIFMVISPKPLWESDIANLVPISRNNRELDRSLRGELSAPDVRHLIVLEGTAEQEVLRRAEGLSNYLESLVRQKVIGGYDIVSRYLPSEQTQLSRRAALPESATLSHNLDEALVGMPFKEGVFRPFLRSVEDARSYSPLRMETFGGTGIELRLRSLFFPINGRWVALIPLSGLFDQERLTATLQNMDDSHIFHLDLKEESNKIVKTYRDEALVFLAWGAAAICILLWLRYPLRRLPHLLLPIFSAVVVVVAVA